ncbi:hypothetical protein BH09BAC3_BH09BAC3_13070 [soil metagenome]
MDKVENSVLVQYDQWHKSMSENEEEDILNLPWYKTVASLLPDLNGKKILEVGCGRGVFANYLASRFPEASVTAVDFSPNAIEIASHHYASTRNVRYVVGDAENLPFGGQEFDFYISCETIEHVFHPEKMIGEINRVLKTGGGFILTTENYFNAYLLVWIKCWIKKQPFESGCGLQPHENFFIFPMLLRYFRKKNLNVNHTQSNYYQWLVLPGVSPTKLYTKDFQSPLLQWMFKPFGRHFTYQGKK